MDFEDQELLKNYSNYSDHTIPPSYFAQQIAHEIVFTLFALLGIACNALIIYTIFKFQRLRTVSNVFLANWAIADVLTLLVAPSGYKILSILDTLGMSKKFMCFLMEAGTIFNFATVLFVIIVSLDWMLACYFPKQKEFVNKHYKFVLGFAWILTVVQIFSYTGYCLTGGHLASGFSQLTLVLVLVISLIVVVALQISRGVQKCRKRPIEHSPLMLTLATAFVLCYTFSFLNHVLIIVLWLHMLFLLVAECVMFSSSLINLSFLYFRNQDFKACLRQVLKRSDNQYSESLSFDNPIVRANGKSTSVQISFNTGEEALLDEEE